MEIIELRPMSLGEILDRAFSLYRRNFWLFAGIMAIPAALTIPANTLMFGVQGSFLNAASPGHPPAFPAPALIGGIFLGYFLFMIIFGAVYGVAMGAATCAVADVYLGRAATVRGSFGRIRGRFWRLMGVFFNVLLRIMGIMVLFIGIVGLLVVLVVTITRAGGTSGSMVIAALMGVFIALCYIGAIVLCIWFALRYSVVIPVLMLENAGVLATIRRSVSLTRGRRGHIFMALLVGAIIGYVGVIVFQGPFMVFTMLSAMGGHWPPWLAPVSAISAAVGASITGPISLIVIVLLYYDTRIRKEAFDLQFLMASLDAPTAPRGGASPA